MSEREEGVVCWFNSSRAMGFVAPAGVDAADRANHLFLAGAALRRSGLTSVQAGDRITYRREAPRKLGNKSEAQDIIKLEINS